VEKMLSEASCMRTKKGISDNGHSKEDNMMGRIEFPMNGRGRYRRISDEDVVTQVKAYML
jgi:hypothetical protein